MTVEEGNKSDAELQNDGYFGNCYRCNNEDTEMNYKRES